MSVFEAVFLGILQGLTEFLPVSSSGHLVLAQRIMGVGGAVWFDIVLHLGTLVAVVAVLRKDIWRLIKKPISPETGYLIAATVPAVILALLFDDFIESAFGGEYLGFGFLITAALITATAFLIRKDSRPRPRIREGINFKNAIAMGMAQGLALLPGISRSGSTLCAGLLSGADREEAARFSFLMSVPVIAAGAVKAVIDMRALTFSIEALPVAAGFVSAALAGFVAVSLMLDIIKKCRLLPFAVYLAALGTFVLLNQYVFHLF